MNDNLPERLRGYAALEKHSPYLVEALYEAADEIERLREKCRTLEESVNADSQRLVDQQRKIERFRPYETAIVDALRGSGSDPETTDPVIWLDGVLAEKQELRDHLECFAKLRTTLREALRRFKLYEMDVDTEPPRDHRAFMRRASALLVEGKAMREHESHCRCSDRLANEEQIQASYQNDPWVKVLVDRICSQLEREENDRHEVGGLAMDRSARRWQVCRVAMVLAPYLRELLEQRDTLAGFCRVNIQYAALSEPVIAVLDAISSEAFRKGLDDNEPMRF